MFGFIMEKAGWELALLLQVCFLRGKLLPNAVQVYNLKGDPTETKTVLSVRVMYRRKKAEEEKYASIQILMCKSIFEICSVS